MKNNWRIALSLFPYMTRFRFYAIDLDGSPVVIRAYRSWKMAMRFAQAHAIERKSSIKVWRDGDPLPSTVTWHPAQTNGWGLPAPGASSPEAGTEAKA